MQSNTMLSMTPREKLIELRTRYGLSQARFANLLGLSTGWVRAIEQGRRLRLTQSDVFLINRVLSDSRIFKILTNEQHSEQHHATSPHAHAITNS